MKTAAAYVRVSTERQDEYSLDSQLKLIREYAAVHDMDVPQEFVFVEDGVSGRSAKKAPGLPGDDRAGQRQKPAVLGDPGLEILSIRPQPGGEHRL